MQRLSGVLMHISSLPSEFGIGTFGKSAYEFVDFLVRTGQRYWQILPLGTTSYGDSPYQSFSAFAGNTHFIDFDLLADAGILNKEDYANTDFGSDVTKVDYACIFNARRPILEKAVSNFVQKHDTSTYEAFVLENAHWLEPFCEYMALKEHFGLKPWHQWDEAARLRNPEAMAQYRQQLQEKIIYHRVTQFFFNQQWLALKAYANSQHIEIIGDMPIYVAEDSVEMWMTPQYFKTDAQHRSTVVAGCPPDAFTEDGQLWGNPIYDWDYMAKDQYRWWVQRIKESMKLYDVVRIDHFRGFESYWEIPAGDKTAVNGQWVQGPSSALFRRIKAELGEVNIIAEDLGFMTQEVINMRDETGFPGMKILQFGFNGEVDSTDLPHHYNPNSVAYVGTHDNETALGWYENSATDKAKAQLDVYLNRSEGETISHALNRGIASSVSRIAIYTMQDLLDLNNSARMNIPSTLGGNWQWRMKKDAITSSIEKDLLELTEVYFRMNPDRLSK